jgi:hypothetical protein
MITIDIEQPLHLEAAASQDDPSWSARIARAEEGFVMAIAPTRERYLARKRIDYGLVSHQPAVASAPTAGACHVPADLLAKGVVLRTRDGYVHTTVVHMSRAQFAKLTADAPHACFGTKALGVPARETRFI